MLSVVCDLGNKHDRMRVTCQSLGVWGTVPSSGPATADHVALQGSVSIRDVEALGCV